MDSTDFILIIFGGMIAGTLITLVAGFYSFLGLFEVYMADAKTRREAHNQAVANGIVAQPQQDGLTPGLLRFSPEEIEHADRQRDLRVRQAQRQPFDEDNYGE